MPPELPKPNESRSESRNTSEDLFELEPTTFELPITFLDRRRAEELILDCDEAQADQMRLNALATLVASQYCQYIGLVPDLGRSTLWNTTDFARFNLTSLTDRNDIADLTLEDGRCLECRPYGEGDSAVFVPRSTWGKRSGFLAIKISEDLTWAKIVGFLTIVDREFIPIDRWSDLNAFFETLLSAPVEQELPLEEGFNRLDDWFSGVMRSGWSTLADIQAQLGLQPPELMPSFRSVNLSSETITNDAKPVTKVQAKRLEFPVIIDGKASQEGRIYREHEPDLNIQFRGFYDHPNDDLPPNESQASETIQLGLLVTARTLNEGLREVLLKILPPADGNPLPIALTVSLLDASGEVISQAKPKGKDFFGFRLAVELGERFGICVALGQTEYTEYFVG
jgi:hypothetical protein